jgi:hypothetical protein
MAKKKNKQREPYRKSSRYGKRGIIFLPFLIFALAIIVLILGLLFIIRNPKICLLGYCFRLVPMRFGKAIMFWLIFASFFGIVGFVFYIYYFAISRGYTYINKFIGLLKKSTMKIEQYFLKFSA